MSGVKGRSGRKTTTNENIRNEVLAKSWRVLAEFFDAPEISKDRKAEIAARLAGKNVPVEVVGAGTNAIFIQQMVQRAENAPERFKQYDVNKN